jgi:uncharacterized membrane protein (DUF4010 family)
LVARGAAPVTPDPSVANFALLLGLAFFFGLAFEELNAQGGPAYPGGIRTFPLLALVGALLYVLDPARAVPFAAGLLVLGAALVIHYRHSMDGTDADGRPNVTLAPPFCNLLAYALGPACLILPAWIPVGATVAAVLLLTERKQLHRFASGIAVDEIVTAGKFLVLTGIILPLLPNRPVLPITDITPRQVWLAVLAVCSMSYLAYILQRYVVRRGGGLWIALLGGLYSSTAATVTLARAAGRDPAAGRDVRTGIVLATSVMYLRLLAVIAIFNLALAERLMPALLGLCALSLVSAGIVYASGRPAQIAASGNPAPRNPLELTAAVIFAALYVAISIASSAVRSRFGEAGMVSLAAIVGLTDIDPFVLSLAQGGTPMPTGTAAAAILVAAASNNLLKGCYAAAFAGWRTALAASAALGILAIAGAALAAFF